MSETKTETKSESSSEKSNSKTETKKRSFVEEVFLPKYYHLLAARANTFLKMFKYLESLERKDAEDKSEGGYLVIETGCTRIQGNWAGDGQSTILFDAFVNFYGGEVISVDISEHHCELARKLVSSKTKVVCSDSIKFLSEYSGRSPDLLYLDSFDIIWENPIPSSLHHLKELFAMKRKLEVGTLVAVDDNKDGKGKGKGVSEFLEKLGFKRYFDEYQIGWVIHKPIPYVFNLCSWNQDYGLWQDAEIFKEVFNPKPKDSETGLGIQERGVFFNITVGKPLGPFELADVNVWTQDFFPQCFDHGNKNILIPNVEYFFESWTEYLPYFDKVLYKAKCGFDFLWNGPNASFLGWESMDRHFSSPTACCPPVLVRDYHSFLHIAGNSSAKQTGVILETWRRHPELPGLIVVYCGARQHGVDTSRLPKNVTLIEHKLPREEITRLMNTHALHLCPSKVEGFGHYINEARSAEAVIVTTDAPPMNEFVNQKEGMGFVVKVSRKGKFQRVDTFEISPEDLYIQLRAVLNLTIEEKKAMGSRARGKYLDDKKKFRETMEKVRVELLSQLDPGWTLRPPLRLEIQKYEEVREHRFHGRNRQAYDLLKSLDLSKIKSDFVRNFGYYDELSINCFYVARNTQGSKGQEIATEGLAAYESIWKLNATSEEGKRNLRAELGRLKSNSGCFDISKFSEDTKRLVASLRSEFGTELDGFISRF